MGSSLHSFLCKSSEDFQPCCDFRGLKGSLCPSPERHSAFCLHLRSLTGLPLFYATRPEGSEKAGKCLLNFFSNFLIQIFIAKTTIWWKNQLDMIFHLPQIAKTYSMPGVCFFSLHWSCDVLINVCFTPSLVCKYLLQFSNTSSSSVRTSKFVVHHWRSHLRTFLYVWFKDFKLSQQVGPSQTISALEHFFWPLPLIWHDEVNSKEDNGSWTCYGNER